MFFMVKYKNDIYKKVENLTIYTLCFVRNVLRFHLRTIWQVQSI